MLLSHFLYSIHEKVGGTVLVLKNNQEIYKLQMNGNIKKVEFDNQYNQLVIQDNKAWIESANCSHQVCVKHPKIQYSGETIVCLPHHLVITITDGEATFDSFSY